MRKYSAFFALTALLAIAAHAQAPEAKLLETTKDSGVFHVGESTKGSFVLENTGKVPFKILEVKTSCGCTTAVIDKGEIAPGARGEVQYEMKGTNPGKRTITMRVTTDPPLQDPPIFTAIATFNPYIEVDPKDIAVEINQGEKLSHRVPLKLAAGAESLKILNATVRGRGFSVALDTPKEGEAPALLVTSNDPLPVGKRTVNATIEYDLNGKATQSVIVSVTVLGLVRIDPNPIQAAFEEGKNEVTVNVKLTHVKGEAFNVKSVVARSSQLREVELPKAPAAEHTLALTFVRSPQRQSPRGFLTFEFDNGIGAQNVYAMFGGPAAQPAGQLPPVTPAAKP